MMKFVFIRVSVLGLIVAGFSGASVSADSPILTECSFDPVTYTVDEGGSPTGNVTADGVKSGDGLSGPIYPVFFEAYVNGTFQGNNEGQFFTGTGIAVGPPWDAGTTAGNTFRFDFYASGQDVEDGKSPLCSVTITYASAGGGGSSGFGWDFSLDHYLQRVASEGALPDTL